MHDQIFNSHEPHGKCSFKEKVNDVSHLCVSHSEVNDPDVVLEQLAARTLNIWC